MKSLKEEFIDSLTNGGMIDKIYGFAYKRCFSKSEAEELCQEIICEILLALTNEVNISNLNAYIWQIANNTYINHINENKRIRNQSYSYDDMPNTINAVYETNMEDDIIERIIDSERLAMIKQKMVSLPEIYRDVMVMYYLDELPMSEISKRLKIPVNRVKQRLFTAKNKIRKEVLAMSTTKTEQAPKLYDLIPVWCGGDLFKYDTRHKISSSLLRKNIIISCRKKAKTMQELSDEFHVQAAIMKDEIGQIPEDFLKKTSGGKYIANSVVIGVELQDKIDKMAAEITVDYFKEVKEYLLSIKDEIMQLPFINPPKSFEYFLWWYLPQFADVVKWAVAGKIASILQDKNVKFEERKATIFCTMLDPDDKTNVFKGKNHNGIWNVINMLGKNEEVRINNISISKYLPWEKGRFFAAQDFNSFPELAMVFKTIYGLDVNSVAESDKEAAAKALEKGYIKKENGKLYPCVTIAPENTNKQLSWLRHGTDEAGQVDKTNPITAIAEKYADKVATKLWDYFIDFLPDHLLFQCQDLAASVLHMEYYLIEEGLKDGILYALPETGCTEGIFATIHYPT
ncbi:MAG: RNA polymerase sigma factor [Oscillospiraceae bacterium]|nr:RNA polymerase sigma factor [Oscillospiraceae bacterium]